MLFADDMRDVKGRRSRRAALADEKAIRATQHRIHSNLGLMTLLLIVTKKKWQRKECIHFCCNTGKLIHDFLKQGYRVISPPVGLVRPEGKKEAIFILPESCYCSHLSFDMTFSSLLPPPASSTFLHIVIVAAAYLHLSLCTCSRQKVY